MNPMRKPREIPLDHHQAPATFWDKQLLFIVGKKVARAEMVYDADMDAMKPVLTFEDGQQLEMLSDEEGNGPGRFAYLA